MLRHCPAGLDADLAEYLARTQFPVLNSTDNSPSDGAECGDSASGEDEFNEGYLDSVNKHNYHKKRMCRFGSQCWRPHCRFRHGNGDRMKQIVKMAHYWTQEVKRLSASAVATDPALQVWEQMNVQEIPSTQVVERIQKQIAETIPQECGQRSGEQNACVSFPTVRQKRNVQEIPGIQVVERTQEQIVETVPQERDQRTVESACVSVPTVQEQVIAQGIPGVQVVERIQKQSAETIPQECEQSTVVQNVCMSVPLAAPRAATVALVDVYITPAPVIDHMPTLVIEHIAPSAVSDSTILLPFHQIHEAVTDMSVPTVRQQGNVQEIPGTQVVKRILKQIFGNIPQERDERTVERKGDRAGNSRASGCGAETGTSC